MLLLCIYRFWSKKRHSFSTKRLCQRRPGVNGRGNCWERMSLAHRLLKRIRFQNPACQGINVSASAIPRSFRTFHIVAANESDPAAKRNVALKTKPGWRRSRQEKISGRREAQDALIANQKANNTEPAFLPYPLPFRPAYTRCCC